MDNSAAELRAAVVDMLYGKERFYNYMSMVFFYAPDERLLDMFVESTGYLADFVNGIDNATVKGDELTGLADRIARMSGSERQDYLNDCNKAYAGIFYLGKIVPLTESNYLSAARNYNADSAWEVELEYTQTGYKAELPNANEPADHIGFQLGFMADLNFRAALCLENQDVESMVQGLRIHAEFFDKHLGRWCDELCEAALKKGHRQCFFQLLIGVLKDFLKNDRALIDELTVS